MIKIHVLIEQLKARMNDETGATAVEYGLLVGTLAGFILLAANALGADIVAEFNTLIP